jgi:anti-sigma regulatory factor (Ser/Thr protein kinase)
MPTLRQQLRGWLKEAGATDRELFEIQLAVTEAFANAVEHPEEPSAQLVDVEGTVTEQGLSISIRDYGKWQREEPCREEGGLGLGIMEVLMDGVQVEPSVDGTTVTMHRRLRTH